MTTEEAKERLANDPDFVLLKRYGFSLSKLMERYPEGCSNRVIAQALLLTEEDVDLLYEQILTKLRTRLGEK